MVDDAPAPVAAWLSALAQTLGAKAQPRVRDGWVDCSPERPAVMMTELRGANAKAKRALGWHPAHPSWRQGFTAA